MIEIWILTNGLKYIYWIVAEFSMQTFPGECTLACELLQYDNIISPIIFLF